MAADALRLPLSPDPLPRPLVWTLGLSLGLHLGALLGLPGLASDPPAPLPPLTVHLSEPVAFKASPLPAEPITAKPLPAAAASRPLAGPRPPPRLAVPAASPVAARATPATSVPEAAPAAEIAAPAPLAAREPAAPAAPPAAPLAETVRPDPDALERYRDQLASLFARQQSYPRLAALRGWHGEVLVQVHIARKGGIVAVRVQRSSGHSILDEHALALVGEVRTLPTPPAALGDREFDLLIPINYSLRNAT